MNFNLYNLLSNLVPGFILYIVGIYILNIDIKNISEISSIAIAYILGYFINAMGGWFEKIIFWTWGGEPGLQLLKGKQCGRINFFELDKINLLKEPEKNASNEIVFQKAMRLSREDERVLEMNASYAFSRSILMTIIVIYLVLFSLYYKTFLYQAISIPMIFLAWHRAKERSFYYAKEVLLCAINKCSNN